MYAIKKSNGMYLLEYRKYGYCYWTAHKVRAARLMTIEDALDMVKRLRPLNVMVVEII